jgi:hypothetical protein
MNAKIRTPAATSTAAPEPASQDAPPLLNLDLAGNPLTYQSAMAGPDKDKWEIAGGDEITRLIESLTAIPILKTNIPSHKWRDIVYYNCQKTDDFYLGRGHYPLLSYCLPGSPMNQANTRKLERDHTENVKRRVRVKKVFPSFLNHFCLLLVDNITSDHGPVRFGPLYKIYFCPTKHQ